MKIVNNCKHPPRRLYAGYAYNPFTGRCDKDGLWIACCECGTVLKQPAFEEQLQRMEKRNHERQSNN